MKKLKWWFLILGMWYLLLSLMNLYMMLDIGENCTFNKKIDVL